jgi:flagellin-specific chaperone FliS
MLTPQEKESYTLRISQAQAATGQLVVITFELAAEFIRQAMAAHEQKGENGEGGESADDAYRAHLDKAKLAVMQLIKGLDFTSPLAQEFYDIYQYVYKLLTDAFFKLDTRPAAEALELMQTLLIGWREAAKVEAASQPVMAESSPQVYAGLTYARDGLAEYVVQDESRGFKA